MNTRQKLTAIAAIAFTSLLGCESSARANHELNHLSYVLDRQVGGFIGTVHSQVRPSPKTHELVRAAHSLSARTSEFRSLANHMHDPRPLRRLLGQIHRQVHRLEEIVNDLDGWVANKGVRRMLQRQVQAMDETVARISRELRNGPQGPVIQPFPPVQPAKPIGPWPYNPVRPPIVAKPWNNR